VLGGRQSGARQGGWACDDRGQWHENKKGSTLRGRERTRLLAPVPLGRNFLTFGRSPTLKVCLNFERTRARRKLIHNFKERALAVGSY
jgi:hypothetical protein